PFPSGPRISKLPRRVPGCRAMNSRERFYALRVGLWLDDDPSVSLLHNVAAGIEEDLPVLVIVAIRGIGQVRVGCAGLADAGPVALEDLVHILNAVLEGRLAIRVLRIVTFLEEDPELGDAGGHVSRLPEDHVLSRFGDDGADIPGIWPDFDQVISGIWSRSRRRSWGGQ